MYSWTLQDTDNRSTTNGGTTKYRKIHRQTKLTSTVEDALGRGGGDRGRRNNEGYYIHERGVRPDAWPEAWGIWVMRTGKLLDSAGMNWWRPVRAKI